MKIAILDTLGVAYDGTTPLYAGLGGSESAVVYIAHHLAQLGHDVTVYNTCLDSQSTPGWHGGVTYVDLSQMDGTETCDVFIVSRSTLPFKDPKYQSLLTSADLTILWLHDTFAVGEEHLESLVTQGVIHHIFTLSDFHTTYIANCYHGGNRRNYEVLKPHIYQTRNGAVRRLSFDLSKKIHGSFVYNASYTKGMVPLLNDVWPRVKRQIPEATLTVIGGFYRFRDNAAPDAQELAWRTMAAREDLARLGVTFTGVIPPAEVAAHLQKAEFMLYPGAFPETFGISILESLMYGTPVITTRFGAAEETAIADACYLLDYAIEPNNLFPHINKKEQVEKFVKMTVDAYYNRYLLHQKQHACLQVEAYADWSTIALEWNQFFHHRLRKYVLHAQTEKFLASQAALNLATGRRASSGINYLCPQGSNSNGRILVVSPFWNITKDQLRRCIESVAQQRYRNYFHVLINDCPEKREEVDSWFWDIMDEWYYPSGFHLLRHNTERKGSLRNYLETIPKEAQSSFDGYDIVMMLDGDDALANDPTIFDYYLNLQQRGVKMTYGSALSLADNLKLIAQPYPSEVFKNRSFRQHRFPWNVPYTHLRTFDPALLAKVRDEALRDEKGQYYGPAGDIALFYELIEQCQEQEVQAVPHVTYFYNDLSPLNDYKVNSDEQNRNAARILSYPPRPMTS